MQKKKITELSIISSYYIFKIDVYNLNDIICLFIYLYININNYENKKIIYLFKTKSKNNILLV